MIKKSSLMVLIFTSLFSSMKAQEFDQKNNSLMWKIDGKNLKESSYLVFTTANLCEQVPTLIKKLSGISKGIKVYYTETGINNPKYGNESQKYAFIKGQEEPLRKLLQAKSYLKIKSKLAKLNIDEKLINQFKPVMILNILSKFSTPECNNPNYTEELFRALAEQHGYEIDELFSIPEAFNILDSYGTDFYVNEIENFLNQEEKNQQDIRAKARFYQNENLKGIQDLFNRNKFFSSRFENTNVDNNRIKLLSERIRNAVQGGGALITLDVANALNSKNNIITELKKQGYNLSPVLN